jgi:hypothetical protein
MTDTKYRVVRCPREGFPGAVMIEMFAPDPDAAAKAGVYFAARETWPKGWIPLAWYASLEDAEDSIRRRMVRAAAEVEEHQARLAAWKTVEICV